MHAVIQRVLTATAVALVLSLPNMHMALAAPPSNDALHHAIEIDQVPFVHREDTSEATASGPKRYCGRNSSVFFEFTPAEDAFLQADTIGSRYLTELAVFTGTRGAFESIACNDVDVGLGRVVRFEAHAGTTYYFKVSSCCGQGEDNTGGRLEFASHACPPKPRRQPSPSITVRRCSPGESFA